MATLSMLALAMDDSDLFENMVLPLAIDPAVMIPNLLAETAELEVIYPDWQTMHDMIGYWSASRLHAWNSIADATFKAGYDPFINVSRDETRTIQNYSTNTQSNDFTRTDNLTQTNEVSAWDATTFQNRDKTTNGGTVRNAGTVSDNGNYTITDTFHVEGDSAVNDSQDIIRKEFEVRIRYDLMRLIIDEFKIRFCLAVY